VPGEGKKRERVKRPAGWYSKAQREERRRARHERRQERLAELAERKQRAEAERVRLEQQREQYAGVIAKAAADKVANAPRLVQGIAALPGESNAQYQARVDSLRLAVGRHRMLKRWDHKHEGTPETHRHARKSELVAKRTGLTGMFMAGQPTADQLYWAAEIAAVAESIERDVAIRSPSYEMPVDFPGSGHDNIIEGIMRVRREVAYGWWRQRIPEPRRAVLDMLVGEAISFSAAALRYRMGKARARRLLLDAIDLWPDAMRHAEGEVDDASLAAASAGILGG
jgi:hypothetical protein